MLLHVPTASTVLNRLVPALKPCGWLVIEDFDDCVDRTLPSVDQVGAEEFDRVWEVCWSSIRGRGDLSDWAAISACASPSLD